MAIQVAESEIVERDGVLVGPFRSPRNLASGAAGSIHDDNTAQALGFRGGTVAGSIHMEQMPPLLVRAFGQRWFERGTLSCYFRNATTDREPVRGFARVPPTPDSQVDVWMEKDDGMQVMEGTASATLPDARTMVRERLARSPAPTDIRILANLRAGQELPTVPARLTMEGIRRRLEVITEPLDWYAGPSPWGGPVANPGNIVGMMRATEQAVRRQITGAVGLFGAIEVAHINGPVFIDHDYEVGGRIIAIGDTPKSEYYAYESILREPGGGKDVASMVMMLRFMKASSPLWTEQP